MNLDDLQAIAKIDKENMRVMLEEFPKQCTEAKAIGASLAIPESYKAAYSNIVFLGMGGSAIGADLIKDYLYDESNIPIIVNRDYDIPDFVGKQSLVFAISYSGNTEETLSAYRQAKAKGAKIIAVTSGGELKKIAEKNSDALIVISSGYPPRAALGFSFIPPLLVLGRLGLVSKKEPAIDGMISVLEKMRDASLGAGVKRANIAKRIAERLYSKFVVIYASNRMQAVAARWRGQLAENSKTLSSSHVYPEMNHNEIVGWLHPKNLLKKFVVVHLRDKDDHARVRLRMDISERLIKKENAEVINVDSQGKDTLSRMASLVYTGDFVSYYLALLNKEDPTPVERVAYLKKELAKA